MAQQSVSKIVDTRLAAHSNGSIDYVAQFGAQSVVYSPLTSSSHSNQGTNFSLNNIATHTCRDSRLNVSIQVALTMTLTNGTAGNINAIGSDNFGLKCRPYSRIISSVTHRLNQATETYSNNLYLDAISKLKTDSEDADFYENCQQDLTDTFSACTGTNINPLASYTSTIQGDGVFKPRSVTFEIVSGNTIPANSSGTVSVICKLYEPLITPFTSIGKKNQEGLYGLTGETINITYVSDIFNNMFAYVAPTGLTLTSNNVSLGTTMTLNAIYMTPHADMIPQIPKQSIYHFNYYTPFSNNLGACAAGQTISGVSSQVAQFSSIPDRILVYCRLSDANRDASTPDKYLLLNSLQVSFDNGLACLSGANPDQLYDISVRNGLVMPRSVWKQQSLSNTLGAPTVYGAGSVLSLNPSLDLSLAPGKVISSSGRYIFQVLNASFTNNTDTDFTNCTLFVVGVNLSILERNGIEYKSYMLSMDQNLVDHARTLSPISQELFESERADNLFLSGGGKWGNFFKKAAAVAKKGITVAVKHLKENPELVAHGLDIAHNLINPAQAQAGMSMGGARRAIHHKKRMDYFYE